METTSTARAIFTTPFGWFEANEYEKAVAACEARDFDPEENIATAILRTVNRFGFLTEEIAA